MAAKPKSGNARSAARDIAVGPPGRRWRGTATRWDSWEPQLPEQRDDEIDCQRIVQGSSGRSLPLYYDDYN